MFQLLFLFLAAIWSPGNDNAADFKVYYVQGKCMLTTNGKQVLLKKGDVVHTGQQLALAKGSRLVMVHKTFAPVQLTTPGVYQTSQLVKDLGAKKSSITSSYFRYIWDELSKHDGAPDKDPRKYMQNTGAASRGCLMVRTGVPVDTIYYYNKSLTISWQSGYTTPYISFYNSEYDGRILFKQKLSARLLSLDSVATNLQPEVYYWQITDENGNSCSRFFFEKLDKNTYQEKVNALLDVVVPAAADETAFMKGFVMEENHLLAEAYFYYQQAAQKNPKSNLYQQTLNRFHEIK